MFNPGIKHFFCLFVEFLDVGKRVRALEALTEAIKNRKPRIWQKSHEDIMKKSVLYSVCRLIG